MKVVCIWDLTHLRHGYRWYWEIVLVSSKTLSTCDWLVRNLHSCPCPFRQPELWGQCPYNPTLWVRTVHSYILLVGVDGALDSLYFTRFRKSDRRSDWFNRPSEGFCFLIFKSILEYQKKEKKKNTTATPPTSKYTSYFLFFLLNHFFFHIGLCKEIKILKKNPFYLIFRNYM